MRLTTIKLSGFKSFVDPTTLHLPTNMTGIVGPNGCGKSNIIDAIRWVMGESAASRLRGDALTDVIFSGSSARKPVGSATVELIFDNSDGTIVGEYAKYNEISVKRVVGRDALSQYFLNGARCRRRDITDLFLGTGLGPRSYSIIEQGMISEIISAHPDELRTYLEEAAGISKYKERRKETESRIKATRENLDRVKDVREEIEKQLEHLKRQARAAERWQDLKTQQQRREAELRALHFRALDAELSGQDSALRQAEIAIEAMTADQRQVEAQLEAQRERHRAASEHLNAVQGEVYKVGGEVARVEQQIQHTKDLAARLQRARAETDHAYSELGAHIAADHEQIANLKRVLGDDEPRLDQLTASAALAGEELKQAEARLTEWQTQWDTYAKASAEAAQAAEVERTRLDYLDRQVLEFGRRLETLQQEKRLADFDALERQIRQLALEHEAQHAKVETSTTTLEQRRIGHDQVLEAERATLANLNETRTELQRQRGRLASLEALQHAALRQENGAASAWLQRLGLAQSPRLGAALQVDAGWERAVETVLSGWLDGVLVDAPHLHLDELAGLRDDDLALVAARAGDVSAVGTLAQHVRGPAAALAVLAQVQVAESLEQARGSVRALRSGQSVITRAGEWLGGEFARVLRRGGAQVGVLERERELQTLVARIAVLEQHEREHGARIDELKTRKVEAESARDDAQRELYMAHRRQAEMSGQLQSLRGKLEGAQSRIGKVEQEIAESISRVDSDQAQARTARAQLEQAIGRMSAQEQQRQRLDGSRRTLLEAREEARMNAREANDQAHQLALGLESKRAGVASLEQALQRMQHQLAQLDAHKLEIAAQLASGDDPLAALEVERQTYLNQRLLVDRQLVDARKALESCDGEFRQLELERHRIEQVLSQQREALSERRLATHGLKLRSEQLRDAVVQAGMQLEDVLGTLAATADAAEWQQQIVELEQKIHRLEPVNLAAIQEFDEQSQRKSYLDAQLTDLNTALETLEAAIKKIDRETRQRFKETFDRVNTGLQELFPRLFGGGHAYLELTGEDLLETGVSIMARPPGKRVSNISLLSGGEKAMCAVALVFSIFRLNPAPFCLLDEVDAPLDEANIGRFSQLVVEMSEQVQFVFVTHNKGTMEAAHQLCGVTMREPGVSRLVQVDLAEAAKLAGAA